MKSINYRAIKLNLSFNKKWLSVVILSNFMSIFLPYFDIIVSSILLDEIYNGVPNTKRFVFLVTILLCGNFIITVLSKLMSNAYSRESEIQSANADRFVSNMYMKFPYSVMESEKFTRLRRTIDENERLNGGGRNILLRSFQSIIVDILTLGIALYFIIDLIVKLITNRFNLLSVVFVVFIVAIALVNVKLAKITQSKEMQMSQKIGDIMNDESRFDHAIDSYQIGKDVRIYRLKDLFVNFKKKYLMYDHVKCFKWFMDNNFKNNMPVEISSFFLRFSIYIFILINITNGALPVGSIIKYVGLVEMIVSAIRKLVIDVSAIKDNTPCVYAYLEQFNYAGQDSDTKSSVMTIKEHNTIEFIDVSFKYDGTDFWALRHINLKISELKSYALVGENGSGKTTLIKLLCRLYEPTEGRILLNGADIREYDYDDYIKLIATVFQDFKLFAFTLGENIALSDSFDSEAVYECIRKVNLEGRYINMENGLQTNLYKDFDDEGIEISGGEGQKIALARALYKKSRIMVFDEPTASLDPKSEGEIYNIMKDTLEKHTTLFVSHRLSSCVFCNIIYVLHHGELIEQGDHKTLVSIPGGKYSELWNAQAMMYKE